MAIKAKVMFVMALMAATATSALGAPMLAVSSRGDKAVNFYNVIAGGIFLQPTTSVPVNGLPGEMCLSPDGKNLFVSIVDKKSIAVIDVDSKKLTANMSAPELESPDGCAVSPDSTKLYSVDQDGGAVFVFPVGSIQKVNRIPVGKEPRRAIFTPDGKKVLVSNAHSNTLSIIDVATNTVTGTVKTGDEPRDMAFSPDGKLLAVTLIDDDSIEFFDGSTLQFKQQSGTVRSPQHIEFAPDSKHLYVPGKINDDVGVEKIGKVARLENVIPVEHGPLGTMNLWGMALSSDGNYMFVTNMGDDSLSVIDVRATRVFRAFPAGKTPVSVVFIKPSGGLTGMGPAARLEHYRSLAQKAMDAVKNNDLAAATKSCQTLEQDWDEGSTDIRQKSPDLWGQIDEAMDDFIHPITHSGGTAPNAAVLNSAYQNFLAKLHLVQ
jgi:YVTN family beta-propeller protein